MNSCLSQKLDDSMASVAMPSANGSGTLDSEWNPDNPRPQLSTTDSSVEGQALSLEPTITFGTDHGSSNFWTAWVIRGPFTMRNNGSIGWEILDADGIIVAWTTDAVLAHVICKSLNGLLGEEATTYG